MTPKSSTGKKATLARPSSRVEEPPAKLDNLLSQLVVWVGFPASWATSRADDDREDPPTQNPVPAPAGGPIDRGDPQSLAAGPKAGPVSPQPLAWVALAFSLPDKKVVPAGPPGRQGLS